MLFNYAGKKYELFLMDEPYENKTSGLLAIFEAVDDDGFLSYNFINYFCNQENESENIIIALEYIDEFIKKGGTK